MSIMNFLARRFGCNPSRRALPPPPQLDRIFSDVIGILEPKIQQMPACWAVWYESEISPRGDVKLRIGFEQRGVENLLNIAENIWINLENWDQNFRQFAVDNLVQPDVIHLLRDESGPVPVDSFTKRLRLDTIDVMSEKFVRFEYHDTIIWPDLPIHVLGDKCGVPLEVDF